MKISWNREWTAQEVQLPMLLTSAPAAPAAPTSPTSPAGDVPQAAQAGAQSSNDMGMWYLGQPLLDAN